MDQLFGLMLGENQKQEIKKLIACNEKTEKYGLVLSEDAVKQLILSRKNALVDHRRVEFGGGVLPDIIEAFCNSSYIHQDNYTETLAQLQEIFYLYKNESYDALTDRELIDFMRKQFDDICFGDLDYLSGTCLERFSRAIRAGYQSQMQRQFRDEYALKDADNDYGKWDEEIRWDFELYKQALENLN